MRGITTKHRAVEANDRRGAGDSMLDEAEEAEARDCDAAGVALSVGLTEAKRYIAIVVAVVSPFREWWVRSEATRSVGEVVLPFTSSV